VRNETMSVAREMLEGAVAIAPEQRFQADMTVVVQARPPVPESRSVRSCRVAAAATSPRMQAMSVRAC
jgi:hypothetical protein